MESGYQDAIILFFIKYPEPGRVKTRLAEEIGAEEAAALYRYFVLDHLEKLESSGLPFKICFSPENTLDRLTSWLGDRYRYEIQRGVDLGERMSAAFSNAFSEGWSRAALIGSDFPDIPRGFFVDALSRLNHSGAVLGPAVDGGYYLIGFRQDAFVPLIFEKMEWGGGSVWRDTLVRLRHHGVEVSILPPWKDIDSLEDLKALVHRAGVTDFADSRTMAYLRKLSLA